MTDQINKINKHIDIEKMFTIREIVVIGLGGTGTCLLNPLLRFVAYSPYLNPTITLVDGDDYESKNMSRQDFDPRLPANKAENSALRMKKLFPGIRINAIKEYIKPENSFQIIGHDNIVVFSCVDNHATRKLIQDSVKGNKVLLISTGNDYSDGNVQVFYKYEKYSTPTIYKYHREIEWPEDKSPHQMSCQELAQSDPQLLFANYMSAGLALMAFYNALNGKVFLETYFSIDDQKCVPRSR